MQCWRLKLARASIFGSPISIASQAANERLVAYGPSFGSVYDAEMTDEELQGYANTTVRLKLGGLILTGKLVSGFEARVSVDAPYALEWHDVNPTTGTNEERFVAIPGAEAVESIELVDEDVAKEIEDVAEDWQTPG